MIVRRFGGRGLKRIVLIAGAAVLAVPADAFACWNLCVQEAGYYRQMYGAWWELDHCTQSWADGASGPTTTCYYSRIEMPE